jgi:uracil phosphoribosyltransferase
MFQNHKYGPQLKILASPFLNGILAKLCSPQTFQPEINRLVHLLYTHLISAVIDHEFDKQITTLPTRMTQSHPDQFLTTERVHPDQRVVCVNLARAGTYPSHVCYDFMHEALPQDNIRQDHIFASRLVSSNDKIESTELSGYKIGGGVDKAFVLFPDPMGATGTTIISSLDHYKKNVPGNPKKFIALHLIVTPEYLKKVTHAHPDLAIYAIRVDRGLSSAKALDSIPGQFWNEEKGLNAKDYIVPGGGGFGEIMNNSFV